MTETKYTIQSTGNYLADALCSLGLFELALRIDPLLDAKCCIGRHEVLQLKSRLKKEDFKNRLLDELERLSKSNRIQQKLDFKVNTGDGRPRAYQVLQQKVVPKIESGIEEEAFKERIIKSTRRRREEYITCYLSLLPIYGKGLKVYDKSMSPASAELKPEVLAAYMTGLAFYTVQWEEREKDSDRRVHLAIVPPLGVSVNREYLLALRRIASLYSTEGFREYAKRMDGIPRISIPLAVLICFDISLLKFLASTAPPQILVFDVEVAKRGGETSRLYESYSTAPTLKFLAGLYENVHEVKEYVGSLVRTRGERKLRGTEVPSLIDSILIELALAINNRNPGTLNAALFESVMLTKRVKENLKRYIRGIYLPKPEICAVMLATLSSTQYFT